jgi:uncharacterized protein (DUF433 family)
MGEAVSTENHKRWGIVAVGILMFFVTVIISSISGNKASFYTFVWIMVSYYGYKGDLSSIKQWMKWLIFINLGVLFLVLVLYNDNTVSYITNSKMELAFGVVVMLIPKIILFFYCDGQLEAPNNAPNLEKNKPFKQTKNASSLNIEVTNTLITNNPNKSVPIAPQVNKSQSDYKTNEEKVYLQIYEELENKTYNKVLWIKLFAEANGDENKAKAQYIKERFASLSGNNLSTTNNVAEIKASNEALIQVPKTIKSEKVIDEYFPLNKFTMIDTVKEFNVERETAKQILTFSISKSKDGFLYKNLTFKTLDEALDYAESNHQNTELPISTDVKNPNIIKEVNPSTTLNLMESSNKDDYFPFNKFTVIDTMKDFNIDRQTAKEVLSLNIRKSNESFLYKHLTFKTLDEALKYAEISPQIKN